MAIAVINPEARALIQAASRMRVMATLLDVAAELPDFKNSQWQG